MRVSRRTGLGEQLAAQARGVSHNELRMAGRQPEQHEEWHYVGEPGEPAFVSGFTNYGNGFQRLRFRAEHRGLIYMNGVVFHPDWSAEPGIVFFPENIAEYQYPKPEPGQEDQLAQRWTILSYFSGDWGWTPTNLTIDGHFLAFDVPLLGTPSPPNFDVSHQSVIVPINLCIVLGDE